jgi:hypothetical protein
MKRYTLSIEPAAHPEARREVVVEARDDGDAYDQAADHAAAELLYHCTMAITRTDEIADGPPRASKLASPVVGKTAMSTP